MAHGNVHVLLVSVDFLNVGQSVVHVVVVDDVRGRVGRLCDTLKFVRSKQQNNPVRLEMSL